MKVKVPKGRYILGVSGGVDSITLLDLLKRNPGVKLIVAHFNHGIRDGAAEDEGFVVNLAKKNALMVEVGHGKLGATASEATAREARYKFLYSLKYKHKADSLITAHHQDDLIETAILNILRGTGRKGVSAIVDNPDVLRPLIGTPKAAILKYAQDKKLRWIEDPSNQQTNYLRNYLRKNLLPKLTAAQRRQFINNIDKIAKTNLLLDNLIATLSHKVAKDGIKRSAFTSLPNEIANELMAHLLRQEGAKEFDRKAINRLTQAVKTSLPNKKYDVYGNYTLVIQKDRAYFAKRGVEA